MTATQTPAPSILDTMVRRVMSPGVVAVPADATLREAAVR
jgi:hypothetical protein